MGWKLNRKEAYEGKVKGHFSKAESEAVKEAVEKYLEENGFTIQNLQDTMIDCGSGKKGAVGNLYTHLEEMFPHRCAYQLFKRVRSMFYPSENTGKFTEEEDIAILEANVVYEKEWAVIGPMVGRSNESVRNRHKHLLEKLKPWTEDEEKKLLEVVESLKKPVHNAPSGFWFLVALELQLDHSSVDCAVQYAKLMMKREWKKSDDLQMYENMKAANLTSEKDLVFSRYRFGGWPSAKLHRRWNSFINKTKLRTCSIKSLPITNQIEIFGCMAKGQQIPSNLLQSSQSGTTSISVERQQDLSMSKPVAREQNITKVMKITDKHTKKESKSESVPASKKIKLDQPTKAPAIVTAPVKPKNPVQTKSIHSKLISESFL